MSNASPIRRHSFDNFASKLANSLCNGSDEVSVKSIFAKIEEQGILSTDDRLSGLHRVMDNVEIVSKQELLQMIPQNLEMFKKLFCQKLAIPNFKNFKSRISAIYEQTKQNNLGKVADYIPQLAKANPELFGVSICTVDGQQLQIGDCNVDMSVQSCCKIVNYCIALEQHGSDVVHTYVGKEPSGVAFNAITLDKNQLPHNPCTNAGAIMTCALIGRETADIQINNSESEIEEFKPNTDLDCKSTPTFGRSSSVMFNQNLNFSPLGQIATFEADRFDLVNDIWTKLLAGDNIGFSNSVYLSEKATGHRNYALGHFMYEQTPGFPPNTHLKSLMEFYFQCCSLSVTAKKLSYVAATLANGGINPFSGEQIFSPETVRDCLSVMLMCGMYDYSGEFAFKIGIPSKSGVSGAIVSIIPNVMGVCTFSPKLDSYGNSFRGVEFLKQLSNQFAFHHFDNPQINKLTLKKSRSNACFNTSRRNSDPPIIKSIFNIETSEFTKYKILSYCAAGDMNAIKRMYLKGCDLSVCDYDFRTPLHLSASCGHLEILTFLLETHEYSNVDLTQIKDRFGNTPLDDAIRESHQTIVQYLRGRVKENIV